MQLPHDADGVWLVELAALAAPPKCNCRMMPMACGWWSWPP
jgi:hypothetical protein